MAGEQYEENIGDLTVWKSDEGYVFVPHRDGYSVLDLVDLQGLRNWINKRLNA